MGSGMRVMEVKGKIGMGKSHSGSGDGCVHRRRREKQKATRCKSDIVVGLRVLVSRSFCFLLCLLLSSYVNLSTFDCSPLPLAAPEFFIHHS